jgi:hypothetical protein
MHPYTTLSWVLSPDMCCAVQQHWVVLPDPPRQKTAAQESPYIIRSYLSKDPPCFECLSPICVCRTLKRWW